MSGIKKLLCLMLITSQVLLWSHAAAATPISSAKQKGDRPHLDFVTFIEPPYFFDPVVSDHKGLVSIILKELMQNINSNATCIPCATIACRGYLLAVLYLCQWLVRKSISTLPVN